MAKTKENPKKKLDYSRKNKNKMNAYFYFIKINYIYLQNKIAFFSK